MCGRYTLTAAPARVAEHFGLAGTDGLQSRWNVAPGQDVAAVLRGAAGAPALELLRWGLVPGWAESDAFGARTLNARVESAAERPAFREAFRHARCLVPADGFYEWRRGAGGPEPYHVALPDGGLFAFAGLHASWQRGERRLRSVALLTGSARGRLRELHDRMPLLLSPDAYDDWLDPSRSEPEAVRALLASPLSDTLVFRAVDARVNDVAVDDPGCLAPAAQISWL